MNLKLHWLTPKSIGSVLDPYPTMMQSTNLLSHSLFKKSGRQTDTQTHKQIHRHTEWRSLSSYSCPTWSRATIMISLYLLYQNSDFFPILCVELRCLSQVRYKAPEILAFRLFFLTVCFCSLKVKRVFLPTLYFFFTW